MYTANQNTPETTAQKLERIFAAWVSGRREHSPQEARDLINQIRILQRQLKREMLSNTNDNANTI